MKTKLAELLSKALPKRVLSKEEVLSLIEVPPAEKLGDYAFPCFRLAGKLKKKPNEIAEELKQRLPKNGLIERAEIAGPYLNFFLNYSTVASHLVPEILKKEKKFGFNDSGKGKKVMVEYSAPNTNKPLHLGHLRNDSIGMAVSNLFEASGWKVVRANLYSNRGIHICKSLLAYIKWGKGKKPGKKSDHFVGDFYVLFNEKAKENPELEKEASELLGKWEAKDKKTRALWKEMDKWAVSGFRETYKRFGSRFDVEFRESDFYEKGKKLVELGVKKKIFEKKPDGAVIADLESFGLSKKTVLRADGTSIYITNDLALTKEKFERFKLNKSVWVVASEQNLYFRQLFKMLELLGFKWAKDCVHLNYGMVYLPEGRMKSREGAVVEADQLMDEVVGLAEKEVKKRNPKISRKELQERAQKIGLGALKFQLLKLEAQKDMNFNPEESISFEGETAPYIQYACVRAKSILEKSSQKTFTAKNFSFIETDSEKRLLRVLLQFPEVIAASVERLTPHLLAQYLLGLASAFNRFYRDNPVLNAEKETRKGRLAIVKASATILGSGLNLLGAEIPKKM